MRRLAAGNVCWGRRSTWRPSRFSIRPRSTTGPIFIRSAWSSIKCSRENFPRNSRSPPRKRWTSMCGWTKSCCERSRRTPSGATNRSVRSRRRWRRSPAVRRPHTIVPQFGCGLRLSRAAACGRRPSGWPRLGEVFSSSRARASWPSTTISWFSPKAGSGRRSHSPIWRSWAWRANRVGSVHLATDSFRSATCRRSSAKPCYSCPGVSGSVPLAIRGGAPRSGSPPSATPPRRLRGVICPAERIM